MRRSIRGGAAAEKLPPLRRGYKLAATTESDTQYIFPFDTNDT